MADRLNDSQLTTLLLQAPMLDRVMPYLPDSSQQQLLDLEIRAAKAYNAGTWTGQETGQVFVNQPAPVPTRDDVQNVLGNAYLALDGHDEQRRQLKSVMDSLELTPSSRPKNFVEQVVDTVKGWFH